MRIVNGKMTMPSDKLPDKKENDIVITMMHHDAEWLDWNDKEVWNEYHKKYSDKKSVIGSFETHDEVSPLIIGGENYSKIIKNG